MNMLTKISLLLSAVLLLMVNTSGNAQAAAPSAIVQKNSVKEGEAEIYLAGGCFWGRNCLCG